MAIEAVLFDIGGVLEVVDDPHWVRVWGHGSLADIDARHAIDAGGAFTLGHHTEEDIRAVYADALGLDDAQADAFMVAMWDWYCGTLDVELMDWARSLAGRVRIGVLSNSVDGARREEEMRYAFSAVFDPIAYSHEIHLAKPDPRAFTYVCDYWGLAPEQVAFVDDVAANVEAAAVLGMAAVLHVDTATTIAALEPLLPPPASRP